MTASMAKGADSQSVTVNSPPSVILSLPRTSLGHSYCFVCKKPGPKLVIPSVRTRFLAYTKKKEKKRLDFDNDDSLTDEDYQNLTGLSRANFDDLMTYVERIKSTKARSPRTCIALLLTKLRTAMSNKLLGTLFNMTKSQVRRAVATGRKALMDKFVPQHLGFQHVSREEVKTKHTRPLARELLADDMTSDPVILVLDGTYILYIYIQKSANFSFQRHTFSMHKHRPLVKPMMVVTTTGYVVSVLGPYLADTRNNDSSILKHMLATNAEEMKNWIQEDDIFVVDRGFRDSDILQELGIKMQMPSFLQKGSKQHETEDSNNSRLVTKVVESANGRLKSWKYLDRVLPKTQLPYIGYYVRIVCALCNRYRPPFSRGEEESDVVMAAKMKHLSKQSNTLQQRISDEGLDKRSHKWVKMNECGHVPEFPTYTEDEIRELTLGVYQVKMAKCYSQEHVSEDGVYDILIDNVNDDLLSAKIQSRHTSAKQYQCWIGYFDGAVQSWYCKCKSGSRVVGCCAHIASVIWYMSYARHLPDSTKGVRDRGVGIFDASNVPDPIDESESEEENAHSDMEE
ncbi:hypothetical protein FSP39_012967 [Pinctada imbricata]|uniref:DDE Tnp4 domain-containing protein n=1 Tax=Pinctada imbricata TaxID=66713 RepID=A0AA88Y494_PINIB|nr:hypothetical protein FSP39_012967 [Pinctada imbricata]